MTGSYGSHLIQVSDASNVRVYSNRQDITFSGAFGISFVRCTGCAMWGNSTHNSGPEAFQMTQSTDCVGFDSYASWAQGVSHDFGSSIDSCTRCFFDRNHYVNSYKGAVGIAADSAPSESCGARYNNAVDCATQAQAAGSGAGPIDKAAFVVYTNGTTQFYASNTQFIGNTISLSPGKGISYGYLEAPASGTTVGGTKVKGGTIVGAGTIDVLYNLGGAQSYAWMDAWTNWGPVITATQGSLGPVTGIQARYIQEGPKVTFHIQFTIQTNNTGAGSLIVPLPQSPNLNYGAMSASGRETAVSGKGLSGTIGSAGLSICNYDNTYPGANGAQVVMSGSYELP